MRLELCLERHQLGVAGRHDQRGFPTLPLPLAPPRLGRQSDAERRAVDRDGKQELEHPRAREHDLPESRSDRGPVMRDHDPLPGDDGEGAEREVRQDERSGPMAL